MNVFDRDLICLIIIVLELLRQIQNNKSFNQLFIIKPA